MMNTSNTFQKEEQELFEETVTHHQEISPGIYLLSVRRRFDFVPGQVVKLAVEHDAPPRLYSICSGAHDAELRILYHVKEGGYLTPRLAALIPGDKVLLSRPYGGFKIRPGGLPPERVLPLFTACSVRGCRLPKN